MLISFHTVQFLQDTHEMPSASKKDLRSRKLFGPRTIPNNDNKDGCVISLVILVANTSTLPLGLFFFFFFLRPWCGYPRCQVMLTAEPAFRVVRTSPGRRRERATVLEFEPWMNHVAPGLDLQAGGAFPTPQGDDE